MSFWDAPEPKSGQKLKPLTIELMDAAFRAVEEEGKKPSPCIGCGTFTEDVGRWIGVVKGGIGPACSRCYNEAQDFMMAEDD